MSSDAINDVKRHFADKPPAAALDWAARQESEMRYEITQWAIQRQHDEDNARMAEQHRQAEESISAARLAAETSRDSAKASQRSAFWTMWAAIAAAVSALVPILQGLNWLPKP